MDYLGIVLGVLIISAVILLLWWVFKRMRNSSKVGPRGSRGISDGLKFNVV
jgi:flagellar biogenesis protein FliO